MKSLQLQVFKMKGEVPMEYGYLAKIYDHLMGDVDYGQWTDYIEHFLEKNLISKSDPILELACGTGNITIPLSKRGYKLTAIDRSTDMLSQAQLKAGSCNLDVQFYQQDMLNLEIKQQYSSILCLCDGINYIIDPEDLRNFLQKIYSLLKEGGLFIFDISSFYKLKEILGENTYGEDLDNITYLWENYYCPQEEIIEMDLTFFHENGNGLYEKHKEFHVQKAYRQEKLHSELKRAGFSSIEIYHELSFYPPKEDSQRIFFLCTKQKATR